MRSSEPHISRAAVFLGLLLLAATQDALGTPEREGAQAWVDKGLTIGNNSEEEAGCYRKAIELDPAYAAAHFNVAYVLQAQEKFAEALDEYRLCLRYDPDRLDALLNAGNLALLAERDLEKGRRYLNRYVEIAKRDGAIQNGELAELMAKVDVLEQQIAEQKGCVIQEYYSSSEIVEILTRRITRPRGGGKLYSAGHVPMMLFETGSHVLTLEAQRQLNEVAKALHDERLAKVTIIIEGHADSSGDSEQNLTLSARRAGAVASYLTNRWQVPWEKITVRWYGEDRPVAPNGTPEGQRKNRRIEINNEIACW